MTVLLLNLLSVKGSLTFPNLVDNIKLDFVDLVSSVK